MPRSPRANEAGGLYHALNRGNLRATIFHKDGDYAAFEKILYEALQLYQVHLLAYQYDAFANKAYCDGMGCCIWIPFRCALPRSVC